MEVTLAKHYGFCQGVKNALNIVYNTKKMYPDKEIYLLNKLVHNNNVIDDIKKLGIKLADEKLSIEERIYLIPDNSVVIYSAHGHDEKIETISKQKNLIEVDAICPRVKLNINSIKNFIDKGEKIIYIGILNHPETIASLAINKDIIFIDFKNPNYSNLKNVNRAIIHNQTTLIQSSLDKIYEDIKKFVPEIIIKNDICFATQDRQNALNDINDEDLILIIGDKISSNSTRLYEVCKNKYQNRDCHQISSLDDLLKIDLTKYNKAFITAGASTPENVIDPIIDFLKKY